MFDEKKESNTLQFENASVRLVKLLWVKYNLNKRWTLLKLTVATLTTSAMIMPLLPLFHGDAHVASSLACHFRIFKNNKP